MKKFKFLILMLCSIIVIFATSCTKDDDMGLKSPCMNHSDNNYYLSNLQKRLILCTKYTNSLITYGGLESTAKRLMKVLETFLSLTKTRLKS